MSYTIWFQKEGDDQIRTMEISQNPTKLTVASGITDSNFDAWRVVDKTGTGPNAVFILRPASHAPHNYSNGKDTNQH